MKPKLLIETDIGRDLDDYLAICMLDSWGVDIAAISVSPGDHDQLALLGGLRKDLNRDWKIGPSIQGRNKRSLSGVHKGLRLFGITPDGYGPDLFQQELEKGPHDLLTIGPVHGMLQLLLRPNTNWIPTTSRYEFNTIVMQGGFCGYDVYSPEVRLDKFEGKKTVSTFNFNGCPQGAKLLLKVPCRDRYVVGKNVCHTVSGEASMLQKPRPYTPGAKLFWNVMESYFKWHPTSTKALHDVVAAACYVNPEIGTWVFGEPYSERFEWGTNAAGRHADRVLVDLKRDKFWGMVHG
jgi:hypothetical protein